MKLKQSKTPTNVATIVLVCKMCKTPFPDLKTENKQGEISSNCSEQESASLSAGPVEKPTSLGGQDGVFKSPAPDSDDLPIIFGMPVKAFLADCFALNAILSFGK